MTLAFTGIVLAALPLLAGVVRISLSVMTMTCLIDTVALPRRQCQPSLDRTQVRAYPSRRLRRISRLDRGHLLPILHVVESVPDPSGGSGSRSHCVCQWEPRAGRGAG